MIWPIGNDLAYLFSGDLMFLEESRETIKEFGYPPEGIINGNSNGTYLIQTGATNTLAERKAAA